MHPTAMKAGPPHGLPWPRDHRLPLQTGRGRPAQPDPCAKAGAQEPVGFGCEASSICPLLPHRTHKEEGELQMPLWPSRACGLLLKHCCQTATTGTQHTNANGTQA